MIPTTVTNDQLMNVAEMGKSAAYLIFSKLSSGVKTFAPGVNSSKKAIMENDGVKEMVASGIKVANALADTITNGNPPTDITEVPASLLMEAAKTGEVAGAGVSRGYQAAYSAEKYAVTALKDLLESMSTTLEAAMENPDEIPGKTIDAGIGLATDAIEKDKDGMLPLLAFGVFIGCLFLIYTSYTSLRYATSHTVVKTASLSTVDWTGRLNFVMPYKLYTPLAAIRAPFANLQSAANGSSPLRDDLPYLRESTEEEQRILNRIVDPASKTALGFAMAPSFLQGAVLRNVVVVSICITLFLLTPKFGRRRKFMGPLTFTICALLIAFYVGMFTE